MRYFKSLLFDVGLLLLAAGLLAGTVSRPLVTHLGAAAQWFASEDYDLRAPAGLVITGLLCMIIGATRVNSDLRP